MIIFEKSKKHPGFAAASQSIATKQGISQNQAAAILASSTRKAGKSARKANPRLNKVKKSLELGDLFEAAKMLPKMLHGGYDWDSPEKRSFVMIKIHNKNSKLHDRYIILERTEHGYKIAKQKRDDDKENQEKHHDEVEKLEKDIDLVQKGFARIRSLRRTPQKASSRRFTSVSIAKANITQSVEKLKNAIRNLG